MQVIPWDRADYEDEDADRDHQDRRNDMMKIRGTMVDNGYGSDDYGPVRIGNNRLDLARSLRVANHSPDGFSWGYNGSGPAQLALAILLEAGCTDIEARLHYQHFKEQFIATLPQRESFTLELDVLAWVRQRQSSEPHIITDQS